MNKQQGAFIESLKRNNTQIRDERAIAIYEDAELIYKRNIEDIEVNIKRLNRKREGMLDLSPTHADSLVLAKDFDSRSFFREDIELGINIRNEEIKLKIAKDRYDILFTVKKS